MNFKAITRISATLTCNYSPKNEEALAIDSGVARPVHHTIIGFSGAPLIVSLLLEPVLKTRSN